MCIQHMLFWDRCVESLLNIVNNIITKSHPRGMALIHFNRRMLTKFMRSFKYIYCNIWLKGIYYIQQ